MNQLALSIAGLRLLVESDDPFPPTFVGEKLKPFVVADNASAEPHIRIRWRDADPRHLTLGPELFVPGSVWRMHAPADGSNGCVGVISYSDDGRLSEHAAVVEVDPAWSEIALTEKSRPAPWSSLLALGAGELIVRTRIILENGLVFHSSAIDDNGRGILMVGHAGAGKSTQASIWATQPGAIALSDDRVGVRLEGGQAVAYGTPWGGTAGIARNHSVPLHAILVLEQAPENALTPLAPADAAPLLLARCFLPYWSGRMIGDAMDIMIRLLSAVPIYQFRCVPDESVIPVVRSVL